jgi:transposase
MGGRFFLAKYSFEFKKMVVQAYLKGEGGAQYLSSKYGVPAHRNIQQWINAYQKYGDKGLMRSRKNETYTFEFKIHVVELYLSTEVSYQELALSVGMNNPPLITKWVNDFRIAGPDALRSKQKGRKKTLESRKKSQSEEQSDAKPVDTSVEHIKQLEDELLKLKIENAYLKELRRLRLEEEALLKKQRESSTASEDPSN